MTETQKQAIREDAEQAAKDGKTPNERCPHPFSSDQGKYWCECYWAMCNLEPAAWRSVMARKA